MLLSRWPVGSFVAMLLALTAAGASPPGAAALDVALDVALDDLVDPGARVEKVAGGFAFTEGPAFSPAGFLLFSDIPNDRIVKLVRDGSVSDFLKPSARANGLVFDRAGFLYACQGANGGGRRVVRIDVASGKKVTVIAERYRGKKLNSPNDLALDPHGGIYFTDPRYGGDESLEQPVMGVYYVDGSRKVSRVIDDLERPNGILVSPGGKHLYVAEPNRRQIHRYEITAPGKLGKGEVIFTGDPELDGRGGPDGMAHDARGNVYATYKGITVLDPDGELIGRIPVPERPANCVFGGADGKTLYITASKSLYAIAMKVRGPALPRGPAATREVKAGGLALRVPSAWKPGRKSRMRLVTLVVPPAAGDREGAEFVVFYFGGGGGSLRDNVDRWVKQFSPEGRTSRLVSGKAPQGEYHLLDLRGTYLKSTGGPFSGRKEPKARHRVINVRLVTKDGPYFLKLEGPQKTIERVEADFRRSFGADASQEKVEKLR